MRLSFFGLVFFCALVMAISPPAPAQETKVEIKGDVIVVDGEPFFPIVVWNQPKWNMKLHKELGANVIIPGERLESADYIRGVLDEAARLGMYVSLPVDEFSEEFDRHGALLFWHMPDEPDLPGKARPASLSLDKVPEPKVSWEGEEPVEHDFPASWLGADHEKLSGGKWLATQVKLPHEPVRARYLISVPEAGRYRLWVREFNKNWASPSDWRFDDEDWKTTARSMRCAGKVIDLGGYRGVGWCDYGEVDLLAGEHTFEIRVSLGRTMGSGAPAEELFGAYDLFLLAPSEVRVGSLERRPARSAPAKDVPRMGIARFREKVALLRAKGPTKPIYVNFSVRFFAPYRRIEESLYSKYMDEVDVVSYDHYPVTGWNRPDRVAELSSSMAAFKGLAPDKPSFVYIENADQDLAWTPKGTRGASALEIRAMAWMTVIEGASGIGWFPIAFNPFRWTNFDEEQKGATARVNREMTELAPVILDRDAAASVDCGDRVAATARRVHGKVYIFAVSLDTRVEQTAALRVGGLAGKAVVLDELRSIGVVDESITDVFGPLEVHIYVVGG